MKQRRDAQLRNAGDAFSANAVRDDNRRQAATVIESIWANAGNTISKGNAGQIAAIIEMVRLNASDSVFNNDVGQAKVVHVTATCVRNNLSFSHNTPPFTDAEFFPTRHSPVWAMTQAYP